MTPEFNLQVATLPPGQHRLVCPKCDGGPSRERSLSLRIFSEDEWAAKCWRAGCGWTGTRGCITGTWDAIAPRPVDLPTRPDTILPSPGSGWYDRLVKQFGIRTTQLSCWGKYSSKPDFEPIPEPEITNSLYRHMTSAGLSVLSDDPDTLLIDCVGFTGEALGWQTRTLDKRIKTSKLTEGPLYYFNLGEGHGKKPLIVVEDTISAIRLWDAGNLPAIALLGTNIQDALVRQVAKRGYPQVVVALDPGAEQAAAKVAGKLREHGVKAHAWPLRTDPKDMTSSEIRAFAGVFA